MESVVSKIIYLFRLLKTSVAFLATVVKIVFSNFLKLFVNQRKMSKLAFLSFVRILIFKFIRYWETAPKTY